LRQGRTLERAPLPRRRPTRPRVGRAVQDLFEQPAVRCADRGVGGVPQGGVVPRGAEHPGEHLRVAPLVLLVGACALQEVLAHISGVVDLGRLEERCGGDDEWNLACHRR
jgi:hypothetical protein